MLFCNLLEVYIGTLDRVILLQKKSVLQFKHVSIGGHFFRCFESIHIATGPERCLAGKVSVMQA